MDPSKEAGIAIQEDGEPFIQQIQEETNTDPIINTGDETIVPSVAIDGFWKWLPWLAGSVLLIYLLRRK